MRMKRHDIPASESRLFPPPEHLTMPDQDRRSFLKWAVHGLNGLFAAVLGIPAIAYLIDARNCPPRSTGVRPVEGIKLSELKQNEPKQGVIRDIRTDAWTLHPNDVVGRVWVVKHGSGENDLHVWTTVCPHLGCSINANPDPTTGFTCPCHGAELSPDGSRVERPNFK